MQLACAAHTAPLSSPQEVDAARQDIGRLDRKGDPAALELACRLWRTTVQQKQESEALRAAAAVGAAHVWLQRSSEALPILQEVRDRQAQDPAFSRAEIAELSSTIGFVWLQRGQMDEALKEFERSHAEVAAAPDQILPERRRRLALNYGAMLSRARQYEKAERVLASLQDEYDRDPQADPDAHAAVLRARAVVMRRQDRLDKATNLNEREIELRRRHPELSAVQLAAAEQNLGTLWILRGDYDRAEQILRTALARSDAGGVDLMNHAADIRDTLSSLLLDRGRLQESLALAQQAWSRVAHSDQAGTARALRPLYRLANAEFKNGAVAEAIGHYREASVMLQAMPSAGDVETRHGIALGLADAELSLGNSDAAIQALQAFETWLDRRTLSPVERGRVTLLKGLAALSQGHPGPALEAYAAADRAFAETVPEWHSIRVNVLTRQCELDDVHCAKLSALLHSAPSLYPETEAMGWGFLARHAQRQGRHEEALSHGWKAVATALGADLYTQAQVFFEQAEVLDATHRRDEAIFWGKQAVERLQQARTGMNALGPQTIDRFLQSRAKTYRLLAERLVDRGRLAEAIAVLRLSKRIEQEDFLERGSDDASSGSVPWTDAEQALTKAIAGLLVSPDARRERWVRLRTLEAAGRMTASERAELGALSATLALERREARTRIESVIAHLSTDVGRTSPSSRPAVHLSARLRPTDVRTVHAYVFLTASRLTSISVGRQGQSTQSVPVDGERLTRDIATWIDDLTRRRLDPEPDSRGPLSTLGRLIDEGARRQNAARVVLWLDGPLRYVPVGALKSGTRHLAQQYDLVRAAPSLQPRHRGLAASAPRLQAFGTTQALAGLPALPAVADELCGIVRGPVRGLPAGPSECAGPEGRAQGVLRGEGWADAQFTEQSLRAGLNGQASLLHIGTHFVLRAGTVSKSWLLLGDGSRLTLPQMRSMPMQHQDLVTISACESGAPGGLDTDGREVDGLNTVLLDAGAGKVLTSLWRVEDRSTAGFMQRFYAELAQRPVDPEGALRRTKTWMAAQPKTHHPYHWAAFELTQAAPQP